MTLKDGAFRGGFPGTGFHLGKTPGRASRSRKPEPEPTMAELLALVERLHQTTDEARHLAWRILARSREWQAAVKRTDTKVYRAPTAEEEHETIPETGRESG